MVKDVLDGLKLVGEGVKSIKSILEAVKDGKEYLKFKHPEVKADLRALIVELGRSVNVIKEASSVLTNFRFAVAQDVLGSELARFNGYFIQSKGQAENLRTHIMDLRSRCSKIREHGKRIAGDATAAGFAKIFTFLGLRSPEREAQLGIQLDRLAYQDFDAANAADLMVECLEFALREVQDALGGAGLMLPQNVPVRPRLLVVMHLRSRRWKIKLWPRRGKSVKLPKSLLEDSTYSR